jgi:hypothetical protein
MAAISTMIGAASLGIGAIGLGTSLFGASEQNEAAQMNAIAQQYQIQANIEALRAQQEGSAKLTETQKKIYGLNTEQATLANRTNIAVIEQQAAAERLRQQQNTLNNNLNTVRANANVELEGLNQQNDALNAQNYGITQQTYVNQIKQLGIQDQNLALGLDKNDLQRQILSMNARREQTQAIRQGLTERAFGVQATTNRGAFSSSQRGGQAANALNKQNELVSASSIQLQGQNAGLAISDQQIGLSRASNAVDIQNTGLKSQSAALGEQSRVLGVQARGIQYGVNQAQFATTGAINSIQDQMFGINSNISNIYLDSYNQNSAFVTQANQYNNELLDVNAATSAAVNAAQEKVLMAGGQISQANMYAANAATIGSIGSGIMSFGNMLGNNVGKIGAITNSFFNPSQSYNNNSTSIPGDLNYYG